MCNSASVWEAGTVYPVAGARAPSALPTSACLPACRALPACSILREQRPPGGAPAPSGRGNFSQIPEPLRAQPPPRPNPRPPPICIIGLAAALPPAAAAAARDSLAVT